LIVGCAAALLISAAGWLCATAVTLAVWATAAPAHSQVAVPLHVAGQLWLAAHHVMLHTADGPFGLSPLGFSVLPVAALVLAGRRVAQRYGVGVWSLCSAAVCYPLVALVIAWSASSGSLHASSAATVGFPLLIAALGYGAGLLSESAVRLDRWVAAAVRAGTGALAVLVAGAALLVAVAVVLRFPSITSVGNQMGQGATGNAGLFLIDLALSPNLVVWGLGFVTGPGFAVGGGSSVQLTGVAHGPLPGLPLLQAVPPVGSLPLWTWLVLAVPLGAGAAALVLVWRSVGSTAERAAALGVAAPGAGLVAGAASVLSGGPVATGAMSDVGPVPWQVALAVLAELGVIAVVGFGLWYVIDRGRGLIAGGGSGGGDECEDNGDGGNGGDGGNHSGALWKPEKLPVGADGLPDEVRGLALGLYHDGPGDLVAPRLMLGIPEWPEVVQQAGDEAQDDEEPVEEEAHEAEAAADGLAVGETGEPDAEGALAEGLPGASGHDRVVDRPGETDNADEPEGDVRAGVEVGALEGPADDGEPVVEEEGGDSVPPPGEGGNVER
jgi:hypothetical protein